MGCLAGVLAVLGAEDAFETGRRLQDQGRYAEAEKYYRLAVKENPRSIPALTNLGVVLAREGKYPDAIAIYKSALKINPSITALKLNLAIANIQIGNCAEAAHWLQPVVEAAPDDRRSRQLLGICQLELGQFQQAVRSFELLMPTNDVSVLLGAATAFIKVGRTAEATALMDRIFKESGDSPAVEVIFGMTQFGSNDYAAAAATLQNALAKDPSNADGRFYLGAAFFKQNRMEDAIREWRDVARSKPTYFPAVFALGALLGERGQLGEAEEWLQKAAAMRPDHALVHLELGKVAIAAKDYRQALGYLRAATKLDPKSKTASYLLARTLQLSGRRDEARAEFERGQKLTEEQAPNVLDRALGGGRAVSGDGHNP